MFFPYFPLVFVPELGVANVTYQAEQHAYTHTCVFINLKYILI